VFIFGKYPATSVLDADCRSHEVDRPPVDVAGVVAGVGVKFIINLTPTPAPI